MNQMLARPIEILLVDDDDDDVRLTMKTFENDRIPNIVHHVKDGEEALAFLKRLGKFIDAVRPDIILLDLNMPRMNGREVLKRVKDDPEIRTIPIVVLTTSEDDTDVALSYERQASSYVTKPVDLDKFRQVVRDLKEYWFSVVRLPSY